jgi:hypothetical protein
MRHLFFAGWPLLFAVCSLHITSTASAEMLLAEITYTTPESVVAPATFVFGVSNSNLGPDPFYNWIESISTLPQTRDADPAIVDAMDRILTTNTGLDTVTFGLTNGPYAPPRPGGSPLFLDRAFMGEYVDRGVTAIRHAPPILVPQALQWYALTAIERMATSTMQTIRIYGFPDPPPIIPEPSAWLLAALGVLWYLNTSCSYSAYGHRHRRCHKR